MVHREFPDIEPGRAEESRSARGRRFARLVESPVSRRVALPRLIVAGGLFLSLTALVAVGVSKLVQFMARWVDQRPEHRIKFSQIELVPPPDPWIKGGTPHLLEQVRQGGRLDGTISLLELNLKELEKDFRHHVWVKDVRRIDLSHYGRLIVELVYRKPVAVLPFDKVKPFAFVLDEDAVVLPDGDILWAINNDPYLVRGMTEPLIKILDVPNSSPSPTVGLPWKRKVEDGSLDDRDPFVLRSARIARFLQDRIRSLKSRSEAPDFVSIHVPAGPDEPYFLYDSGHNLVRWGREPGSEKPDEPAAEARWNMLLEWVRVHGPLGAKPPKFLEFTIDGARIATSRGRR